MQIVFAGNIYDVLETKVSCGITWYKIEDEPNHYDWVHDVKIITDTVTCGKCEHFKPDYQSGKCSVFHGKVLSHWRACRKYESKTYKGDFDDELDEYLFENHQVKSGCCSSVESLKYQIAREVAEKMIEEFNINIQYVSQEERRKKMNEMYGINSIKQ